MKTPKFSETNIFQILKEAESEVPVPELCRNVGRRRHHLSGSIGR